MVECLGLLHLLAGRSPDSIVLVERALSGLSCFLIFSPCLDGAFPPNLITPIPLMQIMHYDVEYRRYVPCNENRECQCEKREGTHEREVPLGAILLAPRLAELLRPTLQ